MGKIICYNPKLKELAKNLRKNSTLAEVLLWNKLKCKQLKGFDWHRQKPIDNYIVDFFCPNLRLAIEIDGSSHYDQESEDQARQMYLEALGIRFLRFGDTQIKNNIYGVLLEIENWIKNHA